MAGASPEQSHFADRLQQAIQARRTPAVVGIDPVLERLPAELKPADRTLAAAVDSIERFCAAVIDEVADIVPAVKINAGFFEAFYGAGLSAYYRTIIRAHERGLLVIGDIKRGDIGSTAQLYARGHLAHPVFDDVEPETIPDAVTLAGYLGENVVRPFVEHARSTGRALYVLVRPSDPGADEVHEFGQPERFYEHLARLVHQWGAADELRGDCGLSCVGAVIAPKDEQTTAALRELLPHAPFLVPGYGAQGGTAESCRPCFLPGGRGAVVNASRSVIYAFSRPEYVDRFGDNWTAAIQAAAQSFANDVAALLRE